MKIVWGINAIMNLSAEQIQLATLIDAHVSQYPDTALGNEQLLSTLYTSISEDVKFRPHEHVRDDAGHASMQATDR